LGFFVFEPLSSAYISNNNEEFIFETPIVVPFESEDDAIPFECKKKQT